jgi:hypothetical protein
MFENNQLKNSKTKIWLLISALSLLLTIVSLLCHGSRDPSRIMRCTVRR